MARELAAAGRLKPEPSWLWSVPRCWSGETCVILGGGESLSDAQIDHVRARQEAGACRVAAINRSYVRAPWADWLYGADAGGFWRWCGGPNRLWGDGDPDVFVLLGLKIALWSYADGFIGKHFDHIPRFLAAGGRLLQHHGDGWHTGLSDDPAFVRGNNSCYQLLSVLPFTGCRRIVLLGTDMRGKHWHRSWPGGDIKFEDYHEPEPGGEPGRTHRAAITILDRDVELGWYRHADRARQIEQEFAQHIAAGCPQPAPHLTGIIPMFATLAEPLARLGVAVLNCSPGSALKVFPQAKLEDVL